LSAFSFPLRQERARERRFKNQQWNINNIRSRSGLEPPVGTLEQHIGVQNVSDGVANPVTPRSIHGAWIPAICRNDDLGI